MLTSNTHTDYAEAQLALIVCVCVCVETLNCRTEGYMQTYSEKNECYALCEKSLRSTLLVSGEFSAASLLLPNIHSVRVPFSLVCLNYCDDRRPDVKA